MRTDVLSKCSASANRTSDLHMSYVSLTLCHAPVNGLSVLYTSCKSQCLLLSENHRPPYSVEVVTLASAWIDPNTECWSLYMYYSGLFLRVDIVVDCSDAFRASNAPLKESRRIYQTQHPAETLCSHVTNGLVTVASGLKVKSICIYIYIKCPLMLRQMSFLADTWVFDVV